jgi:hypothetical protein
MPDPLLVLIPTGDGHASGPRLSYADVTERLLDEFGARHGLKVVSDLVRRCQTGEDGLRTLIAPELLEKLGRVQLRDRPPAVLDPAL